MDGSTCIYVVQNIIIQLSQQLTETRPPAVRVVIYNGNVPKSSTTIVVFFRCRAKYEQPRYWCTSIYDSCVLYISSEPTRYYRSYTYQRAETEAKSGGAMGGDGSKLGPAKYIILWNFLSPPLNILFCFNETALSFGFILDCFLVTNYFFECQWLQYELKLIFCHACTGCCIDPYNTFSVIDEEKV